MRTSVGPRVVCVPDLGTESAEGILFCQKTEFEVIRRAYFEWVYHSARSFFHHKAVLHNSHDLIFGLFFLSGRVEDARVSHLLVRLSHRLHSSVCAYGCTACVSHRWVSVDCDLATPPFVVHSRSRLPDPRADDQLRLSAFLSTFAGGHHGRLYCLNVIPNTTKPHSRRI